MTEDVIRITWKVGVNVYQKIGSIYGTTLEAPNFDKLQEKKAEILKEHSESAEVIDFYGTRVEKIYKEELTLDERVQLVDEIKHAYLVKK